MTSKVTSMQYMFIGCPLARYLTPCFDESSILCAVETPRSKRSDSSLCKPVCSNITCAPGWTKDVNAAAVKCADPSGGPSSMPRTCGDANDLCCNGPTTEGPN